jgi:hypothetical protein
MPPKKSSTKKTPDVKPQASATKAAVVENYKQDSLVLVKQSSGGLLLIKVILLNI